MPKTTRPQSATYGRSTFAGAVNYITRTPSLKDFSGQINVSGATFQDNGVSAGFEGPIIEDKLAFRIGARYYSRGDVEQASDGGGFGSESSKSIQGTLYFKPTDALSFKVRGFYDVDAPKSRPSIPCSGGISRRGVAITQRP